jgi:hypothetical protein
MPFIASAAAAHALPVVSRRSGWVYSPPSKIVAWYHFAALAAATIDA